MIPEMLLRTSMRADIEIYTPPYDDELSRADIEFLRAGKVDLDRPPWRDAILRESAHADT